MNADGKVIEQWDVFAGDRRSEEERPRKCMF
jgi:hypothetical protein